MNSKMLERFEEVRENNPIVNVMMNLEGHVTEEEKMKALIVHLVDIVDALQERVMELEN